MDAPLVSCWTVSNGQQDSSAVPTFRRNRQGYDSVRDLIWDGASLAAAAAGGHGLLHKIAPVMKLLAHI
jgi:hypothetical protein